LDSFRARMAQVGNGIRLLTLIVISISMFIIPGQLIINVNLIFIPVVIGFLMNIASMYLIPWERLSEKKFMFLAWIYVLADMFLISVLVYFSGGVKSPYFYNYILDIIWFCTFLKHREQVFFLFLYGFSYYFTVALQSGNTLEILILLLPRIAAFGLVGWLSSKVADELVFQRKEKRKLSMNYPMG